MTYCYWNVECLQISLDEVRLVSQLLLFSSLRHFVSRSPVQMLSSLPYPATRINNVTDVVFVLEHNSFKHPPPKLVCRDEDG